MKEYNLPWEKVGLIGVDAGLCWIGDPCYCVTPDADSHPAQTWSEFCDLLWADPSNEKGFKQWNYGPGHPGLGVSISCFGGDGTYPVLIQRNAEGLVVAAKVLFDWKQEEGDEES